MAIGSKDTPKKYEELWSKIRDLIKSITNNSDDYYERYIKGKVNSDGNLPLKKTLELYKMIRSVFHEGNKYHPKVFSEECLYRL